MRKLISAIIMILCMGLLSACSQKTDAQVSTVFIEKKGNIVSVDVETLDKDYYDMEELESYITDHMKEYTDENGETVKKSSFEVKDGIAKLKMEYDSYEDYAAFNGIEFYVGTIVTAQAAGYDFDTDFYSLSDSGEKETADKADVLSDDDNKVAIIKANVEVQVPGTILYVSAEETEVTGKSTVSITGEGANEEAALTYIIYK